MSAISTVYFERKERLVSSNSSSPARSLLPVKFCTAVAGRESRQFDYNAPAAVRHTIFRVLFLFLRVFRVSLPHAREGSFSFASRAASTIGAA